MRTIPYLSVAIVAAPLDTVLLTQCAAPKKKEVQKLSYGEFMTNNSEPFSSLGFATPDLVAIVAKYLPLFYCAGS